MGITHSNRVEELSESISTSSRSHTKKLTQGKNVEAERLRIISACRDLEALLTSPEDWISKFAGSYNNSVALCLLLDLEIPNYLSEQVSTSIETLINTSGASESLLRSALTQCVQSRIFDEPEPDMYKLNRHSTCLLERNFASWIHYLVDDGFRMASCIQPYTSSNNYQFPNFQHETAFNMAFQTTKSFYQYYHTVDKDRGKRFDSAMERYFHRKAQDPVEDFFNFGKLPDNAVVVDVGGGRGHHSIRLSSQYPHLKFINQDLEKMEPTLKEIKENNMLHRVTWQIHDYFMEQPVQRANLYLLSHILMDNSDSEACELLKHLFNAMEPNKSILLIDDFLDPAREGKLPLKANTLNLHLIAAFGRPFRTMHEWRDLFFKTSGSLSLTNTSIIGNGRVLFTLMRAA